MEIEQYELRMTKVISFALTICFCVCVGGCWTYHTITEKAYITNGLEQTTEKGSTSIVWKKVKP